MLIEFSFLFFSHAPLTKTNYSLARSLDLALLLDPKDAAEATVRATPTTPVANYPTTLQIKEARPGVWG